jgi:hypothetical protein
LLTSASDAGSKHTSLSTTGNGVCFLVLKRSQQDVKAHAVTSPALGVQVDVSKLLGHIMKRELNNARVAKIPYNHTFQIPIREQL